MCSFARIQHGALVPESCSCRSYGALSDLVTRVAINMALLMELFEFQPPTLRHPKDASKVESPMALFLIPTHPKTFHPADKTATEIAAGKTAEAWPDQLEPQVAAIR